jgi:hypothetical protein
MQYYFKLKQSVTAQVFTIYTRYLIGGAYVFSSLVKINGERFFTDLASIKTAPIHSIPHIFETLYQSGLYWNFIGWSQLIAAFLLMTQRFSLLGALCFLVIMINIFAITVSYNFGNTEFITALMLLAISMLLLWEWDKLKVLFNITPANLETKTTFEKMKIWELTGLFLFGYTILVRIFMSNFNILIIWFLGCIFIGSFSLIYGLKLHKNSFS